MTKLNKYKMLLQKQKEFLKKEYGISELGVFGSYVRGEEKKDSDLDVLVQVNKNIGLLKFIGAENYLSDLLDVKVDLVMKDALKPIIGKYILKEVVYI